LIADTQKTPAIRIEKLVSGGAGLGFADGPVFIPLTAPGDLVVPSAIRKSRGVAFAEAGEILEFGRERTDPPCPWFGRCGGCTWMHLSYPSQLRWKEIISLESFSRIGKLKGVRFDAVHPSFSQTAYRHRARFHFEGGKLGFFRRESNRVVPWDTCLLLPEVLNLAVARMRDLFRESPPPSGLKCCEAAMSPLSGSLTFHWVLEGKKTRDGSGFEAKMGSFKDGLAASSLQVAGQVLSNEDGKVLAATGGALELETAGARLFASPGTFFQVNPAVNGLLAGRVLELLRGKGVSRLLDLYSGNGNFALPAALAGIAVVAVEGNPAAGADARRAGLENCRIHISDVRRFLRDEGLGGFEAVLVDPPRTGLPREVAASLAQDGPETLVYVSCDPVTLARDLALLAGGGYRIETAELFDMFPQTPHAEVLVGMGKRQTR